MGPVLEAAGVPLVLQGHDHYYQRFQPINEASVPDADGIHYIVTGGGGRELYEMDLAEPFLDVAEQRHHFLLGEADGMTLQAIDKTGTVFDTLELERCD